MKKSTETRGERERTTTTTTFQLFDWHFIPPTSLLHSLLKIENKGGFSLSLEKKKSFSFLFVQFSTFLLALALLVASIKTVQKIFRLHFYSDKRGVSFFLEQRGVVFSSFSSSSQGKVSTANWFECWEKRERERQSIYFRFPLPIPFSDPGRYTYKYIHSSTPTEIDLLFSSEHSGTPLGERRQCGFHQVELVFR